MVKSQWKRMNESKKSWFDEAIIEKFRKDNVNRDDWAKMNSVFTLLIAFQCKGYL